MSSLIVSTFVDQLMSSSNSNDVYNLLLPTYTPITGSVVNVAIAGNSYTATSSAVTFTYSEPTPSVLRATTVRISATVDSTITIPTTFSANRGGNITSLFVPAGTTLTVKLQYISGWEILGDPIQTSGSGSFALTDGATLNNPKGLKRSITWTIAGSLIATGSKDFVIVPYDCTITKVTLLADQQGSAVVDIWKDIYGNFPPTVADSIVSSSYPTLSSATKYQDSTLAGWTKTITSGDILRFNLNSISSIQRLNMVLEVTTT